MAANCYLYVLGRMLTLETLIAVVGYRVGVVGCIVGAVDCAADVVGLNQRIEA